ncbi:hypothetical protein [Microbacterium dauci]|jgi:hypothetical protein|uniref:DUF1508 domain-containing protein n=1 Tax=Microbacterium dauci TaxID=3048008 RepID=A0ABT6ZF06_9MICO|nr:hypothetical protein [Microbacterium sp. LX3-4]MDJ1114740.1 hypothetical protein [Microbacterium sp. LX3-4]
MVERVVYERPDGRWGWLLREKEQVIAADGSAGYLSEAYARQMSDRVLSGSYASARVSVRRIHR